MFDATPLVRLYARRRRRQLAALDPVAAQRAELSRLVRTAAATRFGRDHDFAAIADVDDFQARVPLRRFEDFWADYWQAAFPRLDDVSWPGRIPLFAETSGTTTGTAKYIPVSAAMLRANMRAGLDLLVHHLANRPSSRPLGGRLFILGGSTALATLAPGVRTGDLSGIAAALSPWWAAPFAFPPPALARLADWDAKVAAIAAAAPAGNVRLIGGTPSWLLPLFERIAAAAGNDAVRLVRHFPALELVVHGGVNFAPYRERFTDMLAGSRAELREVYPASEGFIATADAGPDDGLRLNVDNGLFFEFIPTEELDNAAPTRHWLATVEPGVDYAIAVSTCAGLWAYVIGDTVRLVNRSPPRLIVSGRTSYTLSAFGEHLIDAEIEAAVAAAAAAIGENVTDYVAAPLFADGSGGCDGHLYLVECARGVDAAAGARFASVLDGALCATNDDYRVHRSATIGIAGPSIEFVAPGTFARWMALRGKLGGQHKVPRIINDADLLANLRAFVGAGGA